MVIQLPWTPMREEGRKVTLVGGGVLFFDAAGLVTESREYWLLEPTIHPPYEGWGR